MKLTTKQKIDLLIEMREYFEKGIILGFCAFLKDHFHCWGCNYNVIDYYIPELLKYKPKKIYSSTNYWFNPDLNEGRLQRIEVIDKTIEDLKCL